jgi:hypothetical protein
LQHVLHGSAFQRLNAFEDGLTGGTETCATYEDETFNFVPELFEPGSLDEASMRRTTGWRTGCRPA